MMAANSGTVDGRGSTAEALGIDGATLCRNSPPRVVAIGGSVSPSSSTELILRAVLRATEDGGAQTRLLTGRDLALPPYEPGNVGPAGQELVRVVQEADAMVFGSPGYHGTVSGLVKNAIDYLEELRGGKRVYLDGLPVGCVTTARGTQAAVNTLTALRSTVHALRGWPTPLGIALNAQRPLEVDDSGNLASPQILEEVDIMAGQLLSFIRASADREMSHRRLSQAP